MTAPPRQAELFGAEADALPAGLVYRPDFLSADEEAALIAAIAALTLVEQDYKGYTARRRVASFGAAYDFSRNRLDAGPPLPAAFEPLRARCAGWLGEPPEALVQALVAEYRPGTPLGWHRDVPDFERIVGVSLAGPCRMRWRRWPPGAREPSFAIELAPRSAYRVEGEARWGWQHSVAPTPALRYSITFRTARGSAGSARPGGA